MNLSPIYAPVQSLLELTEQEIANMAKEFAEPEVREVLGQFLNQSAKQKGSRHSAANPLTMNYSDPLSA